MSVTRMRRVRVERGRLGQSEGDSGGARATRVERGRLRCPGRANPGRLACPCRPMPVKVAQVTAKRMVGPPPPHAVPPQACIPAAIASPAPRFRCECASLCVCGGANARGAGGASGGVRAPAGGCQRRRPALPYSRAGGARGRRQRNFEHRVSQEAREGSQTGWCLMSVAGTATLGHRCRCRTMPAEALPLSPVIERLGSATASETSLSERMTPALQAQLMPANRDMWPACQ